MKVFFFNNGNTMVFDEAGEQKPHLQKSWFKLYINFLKEKGIDCDATEFIMPDENKAEYDSGYDNWTIIARITEDD